MPARHAPTGGRLLTSLIVAAIIPLMLFGAMVAYFLADAGRATARRNAALTVSGVAERVSTALLKEVELAEALASLPSLDRPDLERFYRTAQRIAPHRALWKSVSLADADGRQRMNILRRLGDELGPVTDRESFDRALRQKRAAIGGVGPLGPVSGQRLVSISVPIIRDDLISLVLIVGLSPIEIQTILANSGAPKDWVGVIVDAEGRIVARSTGHDDIGQKASPPVLAAMAGDPQGEYRGRMRSGVEVDTLYQKLPGESGWSVHFGVPSATLDGPVTRSTALLVASCAICLLLAGGLAKFTARDLEQRRREQEEYSAMALAISEERAAVAIKAAKLGTWRLDIVTGTIAGSERTRSLLALPREHGTRATMDEFFTAVHPKDRDALMEAIRSCGVSEDAIDVEFRCLHADGSHRWLRVAGRRATAEERRDIGGEQRGNVVHGVIADIDAAKRASAERIRLTKRLTEAQENEQQRIARELHDQVGQTLTGLALGLKRLEQDLDESAPPALRERVRWLESLTYDISRDIHSVASDLRPVALD
ncbi:MAG: integral rane sensor signal transduction histidine kinase, partial [Hyphomicrobiales bacterium]|nr:integral rane sensor signal transduction histidine kinase [Hyphomicrobiales bacterium]